jgi:hypothetical protein
VMVSSIDRSASANAAGATTFLLYDAWLMLGGVVVDCLKESESRRSGADTDSSTTPLSREQS